LSIVAEIQAVIHQRSAESLQGRTTALHERKASAWA
jgi:hypothetical protein